MQYSGFIKKYLSTDGIKKTEFNLNTNQGEIEFNIFEFAGQEKFASYYTKLNLESIDAVIVMFSVDQRVTFRNVLWWIKKVKVSNDTPIVVTCNKVDIRDKKITRLMMFEWLEKVKEVYPNTSLYEVSCKTAFNLKLPLLRVARETLQDDTLIIEE